MAGTALLTVVLVPAPATAAERAAPTTTPTAAAAPAVAAPVSGAYAAARTSGSYRYWSFWEQGKKDGDWSYATQGPSVLHPGDGTAVGFRFALSEDSAKAVKPRGGGDFASVCDGTDAEPGGKRIAVRVDFGTPAHAPPGEHPPKPQQGCAQVDEDATAADALAEVVKPLRYNSDGLLCAIDGYPRRGCGEQVADADKESGKSADAQGEDGSDSGGDLGPVAGLVAGAGAVAVLVLAAVRRSRGRS
ncbi:SCO2322 family protein [Streptomyces sp. Amel2xB2]|uniref:SCO2322 family protein n=1 Tax=Streptomyces sp. Amel2xB2 TaxID=1305829 RepID=UPI0021AC21F7|nr:SCO2322 family protein [Streptomyces sp. Amel2xB2]